MNRISAAVLFLAVAGGFWIRVASLDRSMSHPEMWAPLIPVPSALADPGIRSTLYDTLNYNLGVDTHPAGYYVGLWLWMKAFGHSAWVIRLPSVLCGVASILFIYVLGRLCGMGAAALVGAALLAANGYHGAWSGFARMYAAVTFFGLVSTVLLIAIMKDRRPSLFLRVAYVLVTVAGVSTYVHYWPFLVSQMFWALLFCWSRHESVPVAFNLQTLGFLIGSPFLAFAEYQSRHMVAQLSSNGLGFARELIQFAMLLPLGGFTDLSDPSVPLELAEAMEPSIGILGWAWFLLCLALFVAGVRSLPSAKSQERLMTTSSGPWPAAWIGAACLSTVVVWAFVSRVGLGKNTRTTAVLGLLPLALAGISVLLHLLWGNLPRPRSQWPLAVRLSSFGMLPAFLAVVPFLILWLFSQFRPVLSPRGLLLLAPYVLLVLASGIVHLWRRRWVGVPVYVLLTGLHVHSIASYRTRLVDPADFRGFAGQLSPLIRPSDLLFFRRGWDTTPILYYLPPSRYRWFADGFCDALKANPSSRVWELVFYKQENSFDVSECLTGYAAGKVISSPNIKAVLHVPSGAAGTRSSPPPVGRSPGGFIRR